MLPAAGAGLTRCSFRQAIWDRFNLPGEVLVKQGNERPDLKKIIIPFKFPKQFRDKFTPGEVQKGIRTGLTEMEMADSRMVDVDVIPEIGEEVIAIFLTFFIPERLKFLRYTEIFPNQGRADISLAV
jgi:hypothetical protein